MTQFDNTKYFRLFFSLKFHSDNCNKKWFRLNAKFCRLHSIGFNVYLYSVFFDHFALDSVKLLLEMNTQCWIDEKTKQKLILTWSNKLTHRCYNWFVYECVYALCLWLSGFCNGNGNFAILLFMCACWFSYFLFQLFYFVLLLFLLSVFCYATIFSLCIHFHCFGFPFFLCLL